MEFEDALECFLTYCVVEKGLLKQTISCYKEDLICFNKINKKNIVEELSLEDVEKYIIYLNNQGKSISTILRMVSSVKSFYLYLVHEKVINCDINQIDLPKKPSHLPTVLSFEEIDLLLEQPDLTKPNGIRDRAMLEVMYASGLRLSELLSIEKKNLSIYLINYLYFFISVFYY